ncbi:MAG: transglutaminase domain-containing protein [Candidatus Asgardarchaeia archaeon]
MGISLKLKVWFIISLFLVGSVIFVYTRKIEIGFPEQEPFDAYPPGQGHNVPIDGNITYPSTPSTLQPNQTFPGVALKNISLLTPYSDILNPSALATLYAQQDAYSRIANFSGINIPVSMLRYDLYIPSENKWDNTFASTIQKVTLNETLQNYTKTMTISLNIPLNINYTVTNMSIYLLVPFSNNFSFVSLSLSGANAEMHLYKDELDNYLVKITTFETVSSLNLTYTIALGDFSFNSSMVGTFLDIPSIISQRYTGVPDQILTSPSITKDAMRFYNTTGDLYSMVYNVYNYFKHNFTYMVDAPYDLYFDKTKELIGYLLDTKVGTSIHFATAFVMYMRILGIPARLALGTRPGYEFLGHYEALLGHLRAYAEVYLPPFGWVAVDPTPAYTPAVNYPPSTSYTFEYTTFILYTYLFTYREATETFSYNIQPKSSVKDPILQKYVEDSDIAIWKIYLNITYTSGWPVGFVKLNLTLNGYPIGGIPVSFYDSSYGIPFGLLTTSKSLDKLGTIFAVFDTYNLTAGTHVMSITTPYISTSFSFDVPLSVDGVPDPSFQRNPFEAITHITDLYEIESLFDSDGWLYWNFTIFVAVENTDNITLKGYLKNIDGTPYENANISFYDITDDIYLGSNVTDENGSFTFFFKTENLSVGDHLIKGVFSYLVWDDTITIVNYTTTTVYGTEGISIVSSHDEAILNNDNVSFTVTVVENGSFVNNAEVMLVDLTDNVTLGNITTGTDGKATLYYVFPANSSASYHIIRAYYKNYTASKTILVAFPAFTNFTVSVSNTTLHRQNYGINITVFLNVTGNPSGYWVDIFDNSTYITTVIIENKTAMYTYNVTHQTELGVHFIYAKIYQLSNYATTNFTLYHEYMVNISASPRGAIRGLVGYDTINYTVYIENATSGSGASNVYVEVWDTTINELLYNGTTNSTGYITFNKTYSLNEQIGNRTIVAYVPNYFTPNSSIIISVTDATWSMTLTANVSSAIRNYTVVSFTVYISAGFAPGKYLDVEIWDNTDSVLIANGTTDSNGYFTAYYVFPENSTLGAHTIWANSSTTNSSMTETVLYEYDVTLTASTDAAAKNVTEVTFIINTTKYNAPYNGSFLLKDMTDNIIIANTTTNSSGLAVVTYIFPDNASSGIHNITVFFMETYNCVYIDVQNPLWEIAISSNVTQAMRNYTYIELIAHLTVNDQPYENGLVTFKDETTGTVLGTAYTNTTGHAVFVFNFSATDPLGTHTLNATFTYYSQSVFDATYVEATNQRYVSIYSINQTNPVRGVDVIEITVYTTLYNQPVSTSVTVKDITQNVILGTIVTNSSGYGKLTWYYNETDPLGPHSIRAEYVDASSEYGISVYGRTFVNITVSSPAVRSQSVEIYGYVTDLNNYIISGATVAIVWNGDQIGVAVTNSSGIYNFTYTIPYNHSIGDITVYASVQPYNYYLASNSSDAIVHVMSPTIVNIYTNSTTFHRGNIAHIYGIIKDNLDNALSGKTIKLYWGSVNIANVTSNSTGWFSYDYTINTTHPFTSVTVKGVFDGDVDYQESSGATTVYVKGRINISISTPTSAVRESNMQVTGTVTDEDGNAVQGRYIQIWYNTSTGTYSSVTVITSSTGSYIANIPIPADCQIGNMLVHSEFNGDQTYYANESDTKSVLIRSPTSMSVTAVPSITITGGNITIIATLTDNLGNPIVGAEVTFYWNRTTNLGVNTTNNEGKAYMHHQVDPNLSFSGTETPFYVNATYNETTYYLRSTDEYEGKVVKAVTISFDTESGDYYYRRGETFTVIGEVVDEDGDPVISETVKVFLHLGDTASEYGTYVTNSEGKFTFTYTVPDSYSPGTIFYFNGSLPYYSAPYIISNNLTIHVYSTTSIQYTVNDTHLTPGDYCLIEGDVLDDHGASVPYGNVTIYFGSDSVELEISGNGFSYTFHIDSTSDSTSFQTYIVYIPENWTYSSSTSSKTDIAVYAHPNIYVTTNETSVRRDQPFEISVELNDSILGPIPNELVKIYVNGSLQTLNTDNNGQITLIYTYTNTSLGNLNITANCPGVSNVIDSTWILVYSPVYITINTDRIFYKPNDLIHINGTLLDDRDTPLSGTLNVTIVYEGYPDNTTMTLVPAINGYYEYTTYVANIPHSANFSVIVTYKAEKFYYTDASTRIGNRYDLTQLSFTIYFVAGSDSYQYKTNYLEITRNSSILLRGYLHDSDLTNLHFEGVKAILIINGTVYLITNVFETKSSPLGYYNFEVLINITLTTDLGKYFVLVEAPECNTSSVPSTEYLVYTSVVNNFTISDTHLVPGDIVVINGSFYDDLGNATNISDTLNVTVEYIDWGYTTSFNVQIVDGNYSITFLVESGDYSSTILITLTYTPKSELYKENVTTIKCYVYVAPNVTIPNIYPNFIAGVQTKAAPSIIHFNVTRSENLTISGFLIASGKDQTTVFIPDEEIRLIIYINDKTIIITNKTNSDGRFILIYEIPDNLSLGYYSFVLNIPGLGNITIPGDGEFYFCVYSYNYLNIVLINPLSVTAEDIVRVQGYITDDLGNPVPNVIVGLKIGSGSEAVNVTDDNGLFDISVSLITVPTSLDIDASIVAKSTIDGLHRENSTTVKLFIFLSAELSAQVYLLASNAGDSIVINGTLVDNANRPLIGRTLGIFIDNETEPIAIVESTSSKGFSVRFSLDDPGVHVIAIKWIHGNKWEDIVGGKVSIFILSEEGWHLSVPGSVTFSTQYNIVGLLFTFLLFYVAATLMYSGYLGYVMYYKKKKLEEKRRKAKSIRNKILDMLEVIDPEKAQELRTQLELGIVDPEELIPEEEIINIPQIFLDLFEMLRAGRYFDGIYLIVDEYLTKLQEQYNLVRAHNETPREFGYRVEQRLGLRNKDDINANKIFAEFYSRLAYSALHFDRDDLIRGIQALSRLYRELHPEEEDFSYSIIARVAGKYGAIELAKEETPEEQGVQETSDTINGDISESRGESNEQ